MYPDFSDLLSAFNARRVEYLVVGAYALAAHGLIRATKDLYVWVRPDAENAQRLMAALRDYGAPLQDVTAEDFALPGLILQIGIDPVRIDILTDLAGLDFEAAWQNRIDSRYGDQPAGVLSREHLIRNKTAAGRPQDLLDVKWLEANKP